MLGSVLGVHHMNRRHQRLFQHLELSLFNATFPATFWVKSNTSTSLFLLGVVERGARMSQLLAVYTSLLITCSGV